MITLFKNVPYKQYKNKHENKIRKSTDDIVISDCRFPNEFSAIQQAGGTIVRVKRGPEPAWYKDAKDALAGDKCKNSAAAKLRLAEQGIHYSEWAWYGLKFDAVIDNNGTIAELYKKVNSLINQDEDHLVSNIFLPDVVSADSWSKLF